MGEVGLVAKDGDEAPRELVAGNNPDGVDELLVQKWKFSCKS